jgi:hypothetical protein
MNSIKLSLSSHSSMVISPMNSPDFKIYSALLRQSRAESLYSRKWPCSFAIEILNSGSLCANSSAISSLTSGKNL